MTDRDRQLRDDLTQVSDIYRAWRNTMYALPARAWTGSRNGKPSSRPPSGRDSQAAAALVRVCRLAADLHGLYGGTWEPTGVGRRSGFEEVVTSRFEARKGCPRPQPRPFPTDRPQKPCECQVLVNLRLHGEWTPDPDDVTLVLPDVGEVRYALLGCEALCNRQIGQRRANALSLVGSMEWTLRAVRMWPPKRGYEPVVCVHCESRRPTADGKWCWWCQRAHETGASCAVCGYAA